VTEEENKDGEGAAGSYLDEDREMLAQEVTLSHWKRILEAMGGEAPKRKQPTYGNDRHWELRLWLLLADIIKPSWKVREEDMREEIDWAFARPALRD
jgi:hypothetical protein